MRQRIFTPLRLGGLGNRSAIDTMHPAYAASALTAAAIEPALETIAANTSLATQAQTAWTTIVETIQSKQGGRTVLEKLAEHLQLPQEWEQQPTIPMIIASLRENTSKICERTKQLETEVANTKNRLLIDLAAVRPWEGDAQSAQERQQPPAPRPPNNEEENEEREEEEEHQQPPSTRAASKTSIRDARIQFVLCRHQDEAATLDDLSHQFLTIQQLQSQTLSPAETERKRGLLTQLRLHTAAMEQSSSTLWRVIPFQTAFIVRDAAMRISSRLRLGLPPAQSLRHCVFHHGEPNTAGLNHHLLNPAHSFDCPHIIKNRGSATIRHDHIARAIRLMVESEHPAATQWQQSVKATAYFARASTTHSVSQARLHELALQTEDPPEIAEQCWQSDDPLTNTQLRAQQQQTKERQKFGDLTILLPSQAEPILLDVAIFSPTAPSQITEWEPKTKRNSRGTRTIHPALEQSQKEKDNDYNKYVRVVYSEALGTQDCTMKTLGIEFLPAVMTILGNVGPSLLGLIRRIADLPTREFAEALHPPHQPLILSAQQRLAITISRYKCLLAAAHANALAKTFAFSTLSRKTNKSAWRHSRSSTSQQA